MTTIAKLGLLAAVVSVGAACQPVTASNAFETRAQGACAIETVSSSGGVTLTGLARGTSGETGQYRLTIKGGDGRNTTSTSQGGAFAIGADGAAKTGTVRLPKSGVYDVDLQLSLGGERHVCSERIGDRT